LLAGQVVYDGVGHPSGPVGQLLLHRAGCA
jgi:hypothetical protein